MKIIPDEIGNYTYMLRCGDGSFYIGWTNRLLKRLKTHQEGKGGKYTRTRLPVELVYYESFETKSEAMSREWHLKRLTHVQKERLLTEEKEDLKEPDFQSEEEVELKEPLEVLDEEP